MKKFIEFISEVKKEANRVSWLGKREVVVSTVTVMIIVFFVALFFFFVDFTISNLVQIIINYTKSL